MVVASLGERRVNAQQPLAPSAAHRPRGEFHMSFRFRRATRLITGALVATGALLAFGGTSMAAITGTTVTSPANDSHYLYNDDLGSSNPINRIRVTGTATGAA